MVYLRSSCIIIVTGSYATILNGTRTEDGERGVPIIRPITRVDEPVMADQMGIMCSRLIALAGEMNPKSYEHLVYPQYAGRGSGDLWNAASWRADIVFSVFLDSKRKKRKDTSAIKEHK